MFSVSLPFCKTFIPGININTMEIYIEKLMKEKNMTQNSAVLYILKM